MGTPSVGREYTRPGSWVRGVMLWITAFWEGEGAWEGWLAATTVEVAAEEGEEEREADRGRQTEGGGKRGRRKRGRQTEGGRQREEGREGGKGREGKEEEREEEEREEGREGGKGREGKEEEESENVILT